MKKAIVFLLVSLLLWCAVGTSFAATYTLPEKLSNQLSIGSGLKGSFVITAEGDLAREPFLKAVADAEFSVRGMVSEHDLHYYIFQADDSENQTGKTELYRKDGVYYLRSDMVQGTILTFPTWDRYLDSLFPAHGENPAFTSALISYLSQPETDRESKWEPTWTKYERMLEMWLADFTMQADVVRREDGTTALDFSYEIPGEAIRSRIVTLFEAFGSDPELLAQLDTVMTPEQKAVYANGQLGYYYSDLLGKMDWSRSVKLNKQVSSLGEVFSSSLSLPLDRKLTGYSDLFVEDRDGTTTYTLRSDTAVLSYSCPNADAKAPEFQGTYCFKRLTAGNTKEGLLEGNVSLKAVVTKEMKLYDDEEERSHQEEQYHIILESVEDEDTAAFGLPAFDRAELDIGLHYYSKYAQNSATSLEVNAVWQQGANVLRAAGKFKTAAPWLFMPFELTNPVLVSTDLNDIRLTAYLADWISNAPSILHYSQGVVPVNETIPPAAATAAPAPEETETENSDAETAPLDIDDMPADENADEGEDS